MKGSNKTLTQEAVIRALINTAVEEKNKKRKAGTEPYKGAHVVFDNINAAFGKYFGLDKQDTRIAMDNLAKAGSIVVIPCKMGAMAYLPENAPTRDVKAQADVKASSLLAAAGLA